MYKLRAEAQEVKCRIISDSSGGTGESENQEPFWSFEYILRFILNIKNSRWCCEHQDVDTALL